MVDREVRLKTIGASLAFLASTLMYAAPLFAEPDCTPWQDSEATGRLDHDAIDESSGLAASRRHDGLHWTHNDSGGKARLFVMERDGTHVAEVNLEEAIDEAVDFEDIAVGPCEEGSDASCVYVADIGDNKEARGKVVIHRFREPDLPGDRPAEVAVDQADSIWFRYPGGARNAETLMVHPKTAALYVVEKVSKPASDVYEVLGDATEPDKPHTAKKRATIAPSDSGGLPNMITAGDIAPDGREFTLRTYLWTYTYCIDEDDDFDAVFEAEPVRSQTPLMVQSEALAYAPDGESLWLTSEGRGSVIYRLMR